MGSAARIRLPTFAAKPLPYAETRVPRSAALVVARYHRRPVGGGPRTLSATIGIPVEASVYSAMQLTRQVRATSVLGCMVPKPRNLINRSRMYLDELPSVRITDIRRSGDLTPDMDHIAVTFQGNEGAPVSTEVAVRSFRMRSGGVFLQFICGRCGRRARVLRLHEPHIVCGRCTGLRYWCEGKPAVRRAQHRVERLKATRFHGGPVSRRPGRTMERRAQLTASLRRSEAVVRRYFSGRILVALKEIG
jgi:hypothetical protein